MRRSESMSETVVVEEVVRETRVVRRRVPRCDFVAVRGGRSFRCTRAEHGNGSHVVYSQRSGYHFVGR
jgi:hypothetical protein